MDEEARSSREFFQELRVAAESEDVEAVTTIMSQAGNGLFGGFWRRFFEEIKIRASLCNNLAAVIRNCDAIIDSPGASKAEIDWAKKRKDDAIADRKKYGCSGDVVA